MYVVVSPFGDAMFMSCLSPEVKLIDIDDKILDGRILSVRIILHGIKISAFCAYAPTEEYADSSKDGFFNTLNQAIKKLKGITLVLKS